MKCQTKVIEVDAVQILEVNNDSDFAVSEALPWVVEAHATGIIAAGVLQRVIVKTGYGSFQAYVGDWLIRLPDGTITVCRGRDFAARYTTHWKTRDFTAAAKPEMQRQEWKMGTVKEARR